MTCNLNKILRIAAFGAAVAFSSGTTAAFADSFAISYLAAGVQAPTSIKSYETFNGAFNGVTNFNGSAITGTYSGNYVLQGANAWGGAGGSQYIKTAGSATSYSLKLSQAVNYFGLWFSALDPGNSLSFYKGDTLVETFSPANYQSLIGACPNGKNPFCGNPNNGLDPTEQFAYLNFYDSNGTFDTITFRQTLNTGEFESDNQAIANLTEEPDGTQLIAEDAPEPASLFLVGTGILGLAVGIRSKFMQRLLTREVTSA